MSSFLRRFTHRLRCPHTNLLFVANLYGDQIIEYNGKRSLWKCERCGKIIPSVTLHRVP